MGGWLCNFAYGGGGASVLSVGGMTMGGTDDTVNVLGSSFIHFCPLLFATTITKTSTTKKVTGIGLGVAGIGTDFIPQSNALGVENTSACGVESLLQVLLRIILGFRPLNDGKQLRASHKSLLFDVILPLHRPSGMVLWRDQTPIIGLLKL